MPAQTLDEAFHQICAMDAPLHKRLAAFSAAVRELSLPFAEAYDELVARVVAGETGTTAPSPGDPMPPFLLPGDGGSLVSLASLLERGPAVISFNRGHWCEYCAIELTSLSEAQRDFAERGASVVSIMPETRQFIADLGNRPPFPILSDIDNGYALEVGLVIWLGDRVSKLYAEHGLDLDKFQGNNAWFLPIPATFVVARDGRIVDRHVDPDFRNRMDVDAILAAIDKANAT